MKFQNSSMHHSKFHIGGIISQQKFSNFQYHQENMSVQCIPLEPHFYLAKLGYAGVYLFLLQNIDCGY